MSSRRVLKAAQAIREVVSTAILIDLKDPRIQDVTVTMVEVSGDLRNAKVYVSVMGDENKQRLCLHGLTSARGFLQKKVGNRIDTRYVPQLKFVLDKGVKHSMEVTRILKEVLPGEETEGTSDAPPLPRGDTGGADFDTPMADKDTGAENDSTNQDNQALPTD